jgi:poly(3-hydroxybutyrate) depolymerase
VRADSVLTADSLSFTISLLERAMRNWSAGFGWCAIGLGVAFACSGSDDASSSETATGGSASTSGAAISSGGMATNNGGAALGGATALTGGTSTGSGGRAAAGSPGSGGKTSAGAPNGGSTGTSGGASGGKASTGGSSGGVEPSSGCGKTAVETGVFPDVTIEVAGKSRTYVLSVPTAYDAAHPYPLVFAWHGLGGNGAQARQYFRIESASKGGGIFVYPDGLPNDDGKNGWDLSADGIDVALFDALIEKVSAAFCVDSKRIFSTGHSFGGFFTERLGCSRGNVLRGIAPVAGGPPFGGMTNCATPVAAWIAHGSNDMTVDFETGESGRDLWLEANGCGDTSMATSPEPCVAYEGCEQPVHWCVHEQDHNWPMFAGAGIWSFFASLN